MDVVVDIEGERIHASVPIDAFDGWVKRLHLGDRRRRRLRSAPAAVYFAAGGQRIDATGRAGHRRRRSGS